MPDPLTLAEEHRVRQVKTALVTQKALDQALVRDLNPYDLDGSFPTYLRSALAILAVGRRNAVETALKYYGDAREAADLERIIPSLQVPPIDVKAATVSLAVTGPVAVKKQLSTGAGLQAAYESARRQTLNYGKRAALNGGRSVLIEAVRRDSDALGWARVSDGAPCAFCAMLVSRGPVYKSSGSGDFRAHDGCGCAVRPFFPGDPDGGWSPDARALSELWSEGGASLADWRARYAEALSRPDSRVQQAFADKVGSRVAVGVAKDAREAVNAALRTTAEPWRRDLDEVIARSGLRDLDDDARHSIGWSTDPDVVRAAIQRRIAPLRAELEAAERALADLEALEADFQAARIFGGTRVPAALAKRLRAHGISSRGGAAPTYERLWQARNNADSRAATARVSLELAERQAAAHSGRVPDLTETGALGKDTERLLDSVVEAGRILDEEIERRIAPERAAVQAAVQAAKEEEQRLWEHFQQALHIRSNREWEIMEEHFVATERSLGTPRHGWTPAETDAAERLAREAIENSEEVRSLRRIEETLRSRYREAQTRVRHAERDIAGAYSRAASEVLAQVRPTGGARLNYRTLDADAEAAMRRAESHYPTEWLERVRADFPEIELGLTDRGYNQGGTKIMLSRDLRGSLDSVATHELGHSMESSVPGLRNLEWALHYRRGAVTENGVTTLAKVEHIAGGEADEVAVRDDWATLYTGKVYGESNPDLSWEVFTTGVESLFDGSGYFNRREDRGGDDAEFRRFILGVLSVL